MMDQITLCFDKLERMEKILKEKHRKKIELKAEADKTEAEQKTVVEQEAVTG